MSRYYFEIVAFISGAVVMILELTGSRILAQYVDSSRFLWAEYATYKEIFPYVYLFGVKNPEDSQKLQNIMLVAVKTNRKPSLTSPNPEFLEYLAHLYTGETPEASILTDDFAPVEQYNLAIQKWKY